MVWKQEPMADLQAYIRPVDIQRIVLATAEHGSYQAGRDTLLILMLAYSGRRVGEVLRVKVKDILVDEKKIIYNILKKKRPTRKLKPVSDIVFSMLMSYINVKKLQPEDYVFKSYIHPKRHITDARVRQIVYRYCELANIPDFAPGKKVHPHTFRHSFAIATAKKLKSPGDLRKLQMILEHSKIDITTHYLQFSDEEQRELVNNVYK